MKSIDNIIDKIHILDSKLKSNKHKKQVGLSDYRYNLNIDDKSLLQKIELEYLKDELQKTEIDNINTLYKLDLSVGFNTNSNTKLILCPVGDTSFTNYYKTIFTTNYDNCYWGLKHGINETFWKRLKPNDFIILLERETLTLGIISKLEKNKDLAERLWNDSKYELTIKFSLLKKMNLNKKRFMTSIGYKETDHLMGSRIYNKNSVEYVLKLIL